MTQNVFESMGVAGKSCAVLGATGGLGQSISAVLAAHGMRLFVHGLRNTAALDQLRDLDGVEESQIADLRSVSEVEHLCRSIDAWARGSLYALVYAAGVNPTAAAIRKVDVSDWDETLSVNLRGAFLAIRELLPSLTSDGTGRIVLLSSIFGVQSPVNRVAYSASKHGLTALVQTVAKEERDRVQINAIALGPVWGSNLRRIFREHAREQGIPPEEYVKLRTERIPLRRFLDPTELANLVLYLCSPLSSYLTGQVIPLTGGAVE